MVSSHFRNSDTTIVTIWRETGKQIYAKQSFVFTRELLMAVIAII